ncbi:hypothetical protein SLAVM298S_07216 [Streptomyces lavendulae subsp. lavendulae]
MRPGQQLSEHAAKQLLRAYGIRVPREQLVTSAAAAVRAAGLVGYPVVMKASGPQLGHKTELGLVKIGLTSASQIRDASRELTDIARYENIPLDGILVCQMVDGASRWSSASPRTTSSAPPSPSASGASWWRYCTTPPSAYRPWGRTRPATC